MTSTSPHLPSARAQLSLATLSLALLACGPVKDGGLASDTDAATGSGGGSSGSASASGAMSADTTSADSGVTTLPGDTGPVSTADTGSMESGSFVVMESSGGPPVPQGLGGQCDSGDMCESGFCYTIPMVGGACSECLTDSDCEMGTCALDFGSGYAACTDGGIGVMCDSDAGCGGDLICATIIDTGGLFPLDFCSECDADLPCEGELLCSPVYDTAALGGSFQCLVAGSVDNGGGCPLVGGVGDGSVCASGFCAAADLFAGIQLGVCGECVVDADCLVEGQTCVAASAGMGGLTPAVCQ